MQDLKRRASIGEDGTLTINSAAMGDLGEYSCVVTGETGDQQSASAFLNVQCKYQERSSPRVDCDWRGDAHFLPRKRY